MTDDREQQFDRALAKHLRDGSEKACPDAEVLSAYHERTLSLEEMTKWKEHITGCERCQETLALVEQTDSVDAEIWQEQNAVPHVEDLASMTTMMRAAAAKMGIEETRSVRSVEAAPAITQAQRRPRAQWKWIAPIGAVAAGIIVWVGAVEIQKHRDLEAQKTAQVAGSREGETTGSMIVPNAPPTSSVPKPNEPAAVARSRDESEALRSATPAPQVPQSSVPPKMIAPGAVAGKVQELDKKKDTVPGTGYGSGNGMGPRPAAPANPAVAEVLEQPRSDGNGLARESGVAAGSAANAPVSRVSPAPAPVPPTARPGGASTITGTVLDPSGAAISGAVITATDTTSGNSKTTVADGAGKFALRNLPSDQYKVVVAHSGFEKSEQTFALAPAQNEELNIRLKVGAATETVEVTSAAAGVNAQNADSMAADKVSSAELKTLPANGRGVQQLVQLAASDPRYIVAPSRKLAWRVEDAGKIERSADGGKTWKVQNSGVGTDLRAGSATSDKVCWVIGKGGTILLTTDGGKYWKVLTSPLSEDLGGIHATDAQHATIWDISNRKSFQTSDGGATWTRTANE